MASDDSRTKKLFSKLDRIIEELPSKPEPQNVHQLRTTIRRIETLLKHRSAAKTRAAKVLGQLKRIRKRAGDIRDLHVQTDALRTLSHHSVARERSLVMRSLSKAESRRTKKLLKVLQGELDAGLAKRLRSVLASLCDKHSVQLDEIRYVDEALERFAELAQTHGEFTEANLHEFRMDCKRVRYLAEMAGNTARGKSVVENLKRVQDAIGEWHDWLNLEHTTEDTLGEPGSSLLAVVRAQKQRKFNEALCVVNKTEAVLLKLKQKPEKKRPVSITSGQITHRVAAGS